MADKNTDNTEITIKNSIQGEMQRRRDNNEKLRESTKKIAEGSQKAQGNIKKGIDKVKQLEIGGPVTDYLLDATGSLATSALGMVTELPSQVVTVTTGIDNKMTEGIDWLLLSKEEKQAIKEEKRRQEEQAAAEEQAKKELEEQRQKEEEMRIAQLQNMYIVHGAAITCTCAIRPSSVVLPTGHGVYIHGIDQLNIKDCIPTTNILTFGLCNSTKNPTVQRVAQDIVKSVQKENEKGVMGWIRKTFFHKKQEITTNDMGCVGDCIMNYGTSWLNGADDVYVEGEKALLGRCRLQCIFGGEIALYTSGQVE